MAPESSQEAWTTRNQEKGELDCSGSMRNKQAATRNWSILDILFRDVLRRGDWTDGEQSEKPNSRSLVAKGVCNRLKTTSFHARMQ